MVTVEIGVRTLIEFVLKSGDIDSGFFVKDRMLEGSRVHRKIQSEKPDNYHSEYYLKLEIPYKNILFIIDGRADGIETDIDKVTIDEIKSTVLDLDDIEKNHNHLHWAQAKFYGYIYSIKNNLEKICIQLTYAHVESLDTKVFSQEFSIKELEEFIYDLLDQYTIWANMSNDWKLIRTISLNEMDFPFKDYRNGQRDMAASVYNTISQNKKLYISAPTGVGKTVSTLFPSLKAMAQDKCEKIFYLTAKEITRGVAEDSILMMHKKNTKVKSLTLTAKSKICFYDEQNCNPIDCKYAKGHFDRVNSALLDILQNEIFISKSKVIEYAEKHNICPFEFSLDISQWVDIVICDYNYLFDPKAKLKRFFYEGKNNFVFLVDEAHNLVDRSREMYSAEINKSTFYEVRKILNKKSGFYKHAGKVNKFFIELKKDNSDSKHTVLKEEISEIPKLLNKWVDYSEKWLKENAGHENYQLVLECYFDVLGYIRISELYGEQYCTLIHIASNNIYIKLYCLDPSKLLEECFSSGCASIIFSATLSPLPYYFDTLGGNEEDYMVSLDSPFNKDNLCLLAANNISTKYVNRDNSYEPISDMIYDFCQNKKGNYIVYFPSYIYMNQVYDIFTQKYTEIKTIVQSTGMDAKEQQEFLDKFNANNEHTLIGFSVLGGVFSEGIDLVGDRLYGTIIVGVGLPQVNIYQDTIKEYFTQTRGDGFSYAYTYPGFNKVMQAAGRVIRTESDRGVVLLIDERFAYSNYQKLFPKHWHHIKYISNNKQLIDCLNTFKSL